MWLWLGDMIKMTGIAWAKKTEAALIAGGFLLYASLASKLSFGLGDEGYVLYIAQQILDGQRLYADIELFAYLPGLFYLFAGLLQLAKGEITTLNLLTAFPLTLNVWLAFRIVKNHAGFLMGLAAGGALLLCPGPLYRFYIPTLNLAILFCVSQYWSTFQTRWLGWLGAITAIGFAIRIDAAACGLAMLIGCIIIGPILTPSVPRRKLLRKAGIGFVLTLAVTMSLLASAGILGDYLNQLRGLGAHIIERSTADTKMAPPTLKELWMPMPLKAISGDGDSGSLPALKELWMPMVFAWQFYLSLFIPAAPIGLLAWYWRRQEKEWYFWLLLLVWVGFNLPQYMIERPDVTHLSHRFFALLIAALISVHRLFGLAQTDLTKFRRIVISCVMVVGCATSFIFVTLCPASFLYDLFRTGQTVCLSKGRCFRYNSDAMAVIPLLKRVSEDKMPGDSISVLPFAPGIAFLLKMPMSGSQVYLLPISLSRPNAERRYLQDLLRSKTRYVLLDAKINYSQSAGSSLDAYAPYLYRTLRKCFIIAEEQKNWQLLRRIETSPTGECDGTQLMGEGQGEGAGSPNR